MIDEKTVRHVARLARLALASGEVKKFSSELSSIFEYMGILSEIDTKGAEPTSQVTGLTNISQRDKVESWVEPDELLKATELPVERHQIRVKPVFE